MAVAVTTTGAANGCSYDPCSSFGVGLTLPAGTTLLTAVTFAKDGRYCSATAMTYNGVSLTRKALVGSGVLWGEIGVYYMKNPPTGSSYTLAANHGSCAEQYIAGFGWKGVNLATVFRDWQYDVGNTTSSVSKNLSTRRGDMCVMNMGYSQSNGFGGGQTGLAGWSDNNTDGVPGGGVSSYKAAGTGATTTMSGGSGTFGHWVYAGFYTLMASGGGAGIQVIMERWKNLLDDIRQARIPPELLLRRYREAVQI